MEKVNKSKEHRISFLVHTIKGLSLISTDNVNIDEVDGEMFILFCNASSSKLVYSKEIGSLNVEAEGDFSMITFKMKDVKVMYQVK